MLCYVMLCYVMLCYVMLCMYVIWGSLPCAYSRHPGLWRAELWGRIHSRWHRSAAKRWNCKLELGHFYSFFNWLPTTSSVFFWVTDHELDHFSSQMPPQITPNRKVTPHNTRPPDLHLPSLIVLFYQGIWAEIFAYLPSLILCSTKVSEHTFWCKDTDQIYLDTHSHFWPRARPGHPGVRNASFS